MFGASNPQQALHQLENYHREGRLERAEVLASDMTDRLMMLKERDGDTQTALVKGLRLLSSILNDRSKFKRAQLTVKLLHKQRNRLGKMVGHDLVQAAEDYRLAGCINANYGKKGAAKRAFAKCEKMQPGHLAAALEAAELTGFTKRLVKLFPSAGPVIKSGDTFVFQPANRPAADARRIAVVLGGEVQSEIERQIAAIESGEQAANARLQAAVDSLVPTHDYHSYSSN